MCSRLERLLELQSCLPGYQLLARLRGLVLEQEPVLVLVLVLEQQQEPVLALALMLFLQVAEQFLGRGCRRRRRPLTQPRTPPADPKF